MNLLDIVREERKYVRFFLNPFNFVRNIFYFNQSILDRNKRAWGAYIDFALDLI